MTTDEGPSSADKVRYLLSAYFTLAVVVCLALLVGGAVVAAGAHSGPSTTTEQHVVGTWTTSGDFDHAAIVRSDGRAFEEGEVLRNRSTYFPAIAPVLNGTYEYEYQGNAESATVETTLSVVVRAVSRDQERDVLWDVSETITTDETELNDPGDTLRVPFAVNVSERTQFAREVREELETPRGRVEILVVAETNASTVLDGERVADTRYDRIEIAPETGLYIVSTNASGQQTHRVREQVEVPGERDPVRSYGSLVAILVGLAGVAGLLWADRTNELDVPADVRERIRMGRERDTFDEWISVGRIPPASGDERVVTVDSLTHLVDVAIDSDRRVIDDRNSKTFVVFDGLTRYEFRSGPDDTLRTPSGVDDVRPGEADSGVTGESREDGSDAPTPQDGGARRDGDGSGSDGTDS